MKIIVCTCFALFACAVKSAELDEVWLNGGFSATRLTVTSQASSAEQKIIGASRDHIRAWQASTRKALWNFNSLDVDGSIGLSPNNSLLFARTGGKVSVIYTSSGLLREQFSYTFLSSAVQFAVESSTKFYLLHGQFVDEMIKVGNDWINFHRWDLGDDFESSKLDLISLVGSRWLAVNRTGSQVRVYDRVNRTAAPTHTLAPVTNGIGGLAVSPDGTKLAFTSGNFVYVYRTSDFTSLGSFRAPKDNPLNIEWFPDGDLALNCKPYGFWHLLKVSQSGVLRWKYDGDEGLSSGRSPLCVSRSGLVAWQPTPDISLTSKLGGNIGVIASTAAVLDIVAGDEVVFTVSRTHLTGYDPTTGLRTRLKESVDDIMAASYGAGKLVWSTDSNTYVMSPKNNSMLPAIPGGVDPDPVSYYISRQRMTTSRGIVPAANSGLIAIAKSGAINFHRTSNGSSFRTLNVGIWLPTILKFSHDGSRFILVGGGRMLVWATSSLTGLATPELDLELDYLVDEALIDPLGSTIVVLDSTNLLHVYRRNGIGSWAHSGDFQSSLSKEGFLRAGAVSPDGSRLVLGSGGLSTGVVEVWNLSPFTKQLAYMTEGAADLVTYGFSGQTLYLSNRYEDNSDAHMVCAWNPFRLSAPWTMTCASSSVVGGSPVTFTLTLSKAAPGNGFAVPLASSMPSVIS
ncbi:MAG TPA: hypothetical protein PKA27_17480, partial [Fimbriimonadaceae bacterium]|nr:hypothetical protein [Fimbriimonadaceae bacterium]